MRMCLFSVARIMMNATVDRERHPFPPQEGGEEEE